MSGAVVDQARTDEFRLGTLLVRASHRELVHTDGRRELIEPRMMQVLVVLAGARGMVGRDELTARYWEGRIVGEDARPRWSAPTPGANGC